ncbi:hypothetical protein LTS12_027655 [Elasticomyces elasticus]|nr:hypothetical protein LTS12_027655 [Elasticomyces elasticus]
MERLQDEITATDQKQIVKSNALTVDRVFNSLTPRQENGVVWEIKALKNQRSALEYCITLAKWLVGEQQRLLEKQEKAATRTRDAITQIQCLLVQLAV